LFVVGTPVAPITIFPVYGAACGTRLLLSTDTVSVVGIPGSTTPARGLTVIQVAPCGAAVNEIGPPVVFRTTIWSAGGFGGVAKSSTKALTVSEGRGAVTVNVTGIAMVANPVAATFKFAE
jgi:hypothetical protein